MPVCPATVATILLQLGVNKLTTETSTNNKRSRNSLFADERRPGFHGFDSSHLIHF